MAAWVRFTYKTNIIWHKIRKAGGSDGHGVGFYFRNVTEILLFGPKDRLRARLPLTDQMSVMTPSFRYRQDRPSSLPVLGRERTSGCQAGKLSELLGWGSFLLVQQHAVAFK